MSDSFGEEKGPVLWCTWAHRIIAREKGNMSVFAKMLIRELPGGAQSKLLYASDGQMYVVKFQNNPQGKRILANEFLATGLAEALSLPVPECETIDVHQTLIKEDPGFSLEFESQTSPCASGLQFGSRYVLRLPNAGQIFVGEPNSVPKDVRNLNAFAGILLFDMWTYNSDRRQAVFYKSSAEKKFTVAFIDHGYCFNALEWRLRDAPSTALFGNPLVYASVTGWDSFEPWLSKIEQLDEALIWSCAKAIPSEWHEDESALARLIDELIGRRAKVRGYVDQLQKCSIKHFPNWHPQAFLGPSLGHKLPLNCVAN